MTEEQLRLLFRGVTYAGYPLMVLPALAAWWRRSVRAAHWWVAVGILVALLSNLLMTTLKMLAIPNHFVWTWFAVPVAGCLLLGIAEYQASPLERLATRLMVPLFAIVWVTVRLVVDTSPTFKPWLDPFFSLTILGAATWAWVRRAVTAHAEPMLRQDWYWVLGGLALYGAVTAPATPLAAYLLQNDQDGMVIQIWLVRNVLISLAWLLVTWGILCHRPLTPSGSSSSPAPSS